MDLFIVLSALGLADSKSLSVFSASVSLSFIYLISVGLPLIPSYPQIKRCYPAVSSKCYLTAFLSRSKVFNMVSCYRVFFYQMLGFLHFLDINNDYRSIHEMHFKAAPSTQ